MGMYDHIRIRSPLLNREWQETQFQTKSLERLLVDYEVDAHGQLWQVGHAERRSPDGPQREQLSGVVIFYGGTAQGGMEHFRARFVQGVLQKIEQISREEADGDPARFAASDDEQRAWQIADIKAGLAEADRGEFATADEVNVVFAKYGA